MTGGEGAPPERQNDKGAISGAWIAPYMETRSRRQVSPPTPRAKTVTQDGMHAAQRGTDCRARRPPCSQFVHKMHCSGSSLREVSASVRCSSSRLRKLYIVSANNLAEVMSRVLAVVTTVLTSTPRPPIWCPTGQRFPCHPRTMRYVGRRPMTLEAGRRRPASPARSATHLGRTPRIGHPSAVCRTRAPRSERGQRTILRSSHAGTGPSFGRRRTISVAGR